jgi:hypothetical protein
MPLPFQDPARVLECGRAFSRVKDQVVRRMVDDTGNGEEHTTSLISFVCVLFPMFFDTQFPMRSICGMNYCNLHDESTMLLG